MKCYQVRITGRVQGVFYRVSMRDKAIELGVKGFVKNMKDGSVYAEIEGNEEILEKLIAWSNLGPPGARVDNVMITPQASVNYVDFQIRRN